MAYRFHVLEGIYKPRNLIIGLGLGLATVAAAKSMMGIENNQMITKKNEDGKKKLVEAWYNSKSDRWETPAPWSKAFREQNPEIKLVAREKIFSPKA